MLQLIRPITVVRGHVRLSARTADILHPDVPIRGPTFAEFSEANHYCLTTRYLSHTIQTRLLDPALLPVLLRTVRATIFPNNGLAPPRTPPTADEAKSIKNHCAIAVLELVPPKVATAFFATHSKPAQLLQVEAVLDCLDDSYLNKHLIFQIVELIVLRLVPELGERGVRELMDERLG